MRAQTRGQHAARVEAAIATGEAAKSALVVSWRRSSRLHQLDPALSRSPMRLTDAELRRAREQDEPLMRTAQSALNHLHAYPAHAAFGGYKQSGIGARRTR